MAGAPLSVVLVGCGRLGSAIVEGWLGAESFDPAGLAILTPSEKPVAEAARTRGARINPPLADLGTAHAVVLAVKPAIWRAVSADIVSALSPDATLLSVMAGVPSAAIAEAFDGRAVARVMPTTGVASGRGVASIWAAQAPARAVAHALFDPIAEVVDLDEESLIDAATAMSGSGPAYLYAFIQAMAAAGEGAGLDAATAERLARGTLRSAAAGVDRPLSVAALIAQVASPGGTTEAGLKALAAADLDDAVRGAVAAALRRTRELSLD